MNIKTPKSWRKGQTLFNFLEWLRLEKNIPSNQSSRMADPFHLTNQEINKLYKEFLSKNK